MDANAISSWKLPIFARIGKKSDLWAERDPDTPVGGIIKINENVGLVRETRL